jgi:hypothetical protein
VIIFLLLVITLQHCKQNSKLNANIDSTKSIAITVDSIKVLVDKTYIVNEVELMLEINRLQTAKLILYDWNSVVRTAVRPDDRMNAYDVEIAKLSKELQRLKDNK